MSATKQYVVGDLDVLLLGRASDGLSPAISNYRLLKHKPREVLDLRKRVPLSVTDAMDAVQKYYMRKARYPTRIRMHRAARAALGDPDHLYGIKVTL